MKLEKGFLNTTILFLVTLVSILSLANSVSAISLEPKHKIVIQVNSNDPAIQQASLNVIVNLQKHYGIDNIAIEVVAFGPGISLVTEKSTQTSRIESLVMQNVTFTACGNTLNTIKKRTGKKPKLLNDVTTVPTGVARIVELQEMGYAYFRL